jgi:excisionase family DNA binding protein
MAKRERASPSELYAIASEIAPTGFWILPTARFGSSPRVFAGGHLAPRAIKSWWIGGPSACEARPTDMPKRELTLQPTVEKLGLTVSEAAALSSLGQTSIYKAIREGRLRIRKYGTRTIITRADLASFLENLPDETERPEG